MENEQECIGIVSKNGGIYVPEHGVYTITPQGFAVGDYAMITFDTEKYGGDTVKKTIHATISQLFDVKEKLAIDFEVLANFFAKSSLTDKTAIITAANQIVANIEKQGGE